MKYFAFFVLFVACTSAPHNTLRVAVTDTSHAQMLEFVRPELAAQGVELEIILTSDSRYPNRALAERQVDATFCCHLPFLEEEIQEFGYRIESLVPIAFEPFGLYSKNHESLADLEPQSRVAIPNDPTNEKRARLLLGNFPLQLIPMDSALLLQALDELEAAILPASLASLKPLLLEAHDARYAHVLAVRWQAHKRPDIQALKVALTSPAMHSFLLYQYKGALIPVSVQETSK